MSNSTKLRLLGALAVVLVVVGIVLVASIVGSLWITRDQSASRKDGHS